MPIMEAATAKGETSMTIPSILKPPACLVLAGALAFGAMGAGAALAQAAAPAEPAPALDSGNTAWMLTATALVLMMTIPGLALFYGGMVRKKNVLATVMQSFAICCLVTVLWFVVGYSLAFSDGGAVNQWIGGLSKAFHKGITVSTLWAPGVANIPEFVFSTFQMTFAIITPALIAGAFAERMKFSALLIFMALWLLVVYAPIAHWVWGGGFLGAAGVLDFAGGTVVHINAGVAGLVTALVLGKRAGYGTVNMAPHNLVYSVIGAALLWVGWFGFNAGSELAADGLAGAAMLLSSQDGETVSPEAVAAASHIAQLLLPLTARIDPDLATRTRAVLVSLPDDAKPGGAIRALGEDLSAMRRALALPEAERKS